MIEQGKNKIVILTDIKLQQYNITGVIIAFTSICGKYGTQFRASSEVLKPRT
jgi:hypothetical protein